MSFNYIGQPPYPLARPLSQEECRIGRILMHPFLHHSIKDHFKDENVPLAIKQYYSFACALNHYHSIIKGTLQILNNKPNTPLDPYLAVSNIQILHQNVLTNLDDSIRALIALNVKATIPDYLFRKENPITDLRFQNVCTSCGYSGHYPLDCHHWICPCCHQWAPGHKANDCPARPENQTTQIIDQENALPIPNPQTNQEGAIRSSHSSPGPESAQNNPPTTPTSSPERSDPQEYRLRLRSRNHRLQTILHPATRRASQRRTVRIQLGEPTRIPVSNRFALLDTEDSSESGGQQDEAPNGLVNGRVVSSEGDNSSA